MYISELKLWNFRKYGGDDFDQTKPHIIVPFKKGMNVLIGENDSGKTAIIDAIKYVLKTNAYEAIRIQQDDFYNDKEHLRIELLIDDVTDSEASNFTEIISPRKGVALASLKLVLDVVRKDGHIQAYEVKGGNDADGHSLTPLMKDNLRITYLKPLRDAENELTAKKNSRLSQILQSHELLKQNSNGEKHDLIKIIEDANAEVEAWFEDDTGGDASHKKLIKGVIDKFVKMDICDFDAILKLMQDEQIDGIIHLAAESHVDRSIKDPFTFAQTNVMGTLSLLQAAKTYWESLPGRYEGKRFYHISTDEVYGALKMTHPEGIPAPFTTKASSGKNHEAYGEEFFLETTKYNPHSPYSASKASSDHFVRAFHDTYGMPTIVTNCSNNYGPYQFPEKLIPLFINNIRHRKPLPVYGRGENVRDWLYVEDHARAIDMIFHNGKIAETYNIGGFNEWKNIDIIKVVINTVDRLLGRKEGEDMDLITYVTDRLGHDARYAIDSRKLQKELGWEPSLQFEEGVEKTVKWYLDNQDWMDNVTSGDYQKYYKNMYKNR